MKAGLAWQINNPYRLSSFPTFSGQFAHQLIAVPSLQMQGHHEWKLAQTMPNTHLRKPCCLPSWGYLMLHNLNKRNNFFLYEQKILLPQKQCREIFIAVLSNRLFCNSKQQNDQPHSRRSQMPDLCWQAEGSQAGSSPASLRKPSF